MYKAILKSDFNVVADPFMTPLAVGCADLVLPVAMSCERDSLNACSVPLTSIKKVVEPWEDSKTDEEIMLDVIKRLHPERAPWNNVKEWLNSMLDRCDWTPGAQEGAPVPLNYDTLAEQGVAYPNQTYQKYAKGLIRPDGKPGFNTVTGKIELYLPLFESLGDWIRCRTTSSRTTARTRRPSADRRIRRWCSRPVAAASSSSIRSTAR